MLLSALGFSFAALVLAGIGWFLAGRKSARVRPDATAKSTAAQSPPLPELVDSFENAFYQLVLPRGRGTGETRSDSVIHAFRDQHEKLAEDPTLLPRQPLILPKLLRLVKHESGNAQALKAIILEDPGLTADVLKMANSPLYRNTRESVNDLDYAIIMLGIDGLKSLISATIMRPIFKASDRRDKQTTNLLWEYALASAFTAQRFETKCETKSDMKSGSKHSAKPSASDAFSAHLLTLLSCIAELIIVQTTLRLFDEHQEPIDLETFAYLNQHFRYPISQQLMKTWCLDEDLINQLSDPKQLQPTSMTTAQDLGRIFGRARVLREHGDLALEEIESTVKEMQLESKLVDFLLAGGDDQRAVG